MKQVLAGALLALALAPGLLPASAEAHGGDPDYRSEIHGVEPARLGQGIELRVLDFDADIELVNESGREVLVRGYEGEPYVRIAADGAVEVNELSPAYYLNRDRYAQVEVPDRADPKAKPDWKLLDRSGEFTWHDHRSHYMGEGTPSQVEDESKRTEVFDYEIPVEVDGQPAKIAGTLIWVGRDGGFPLAPFAGLAAVVALGAGFLLWRRRRGDDGRERDETGGEAW